MIATPQPIALVADADCVQWLMGTPQVFGGQIPPAERLQCSAPAIRAQAPGNQPIVLVRRSPSSRH